MSSNRSSSAASIAGVNEVVSRSVDFELTIADVVRRSERRAWRVAISAIVMTLILAGGYFYMLPLKQKVPYLVMADAFTGTATVVGMSPSAVHNITAHDAINRSNVAHFVLARESYDVMMMKLQDWVTVLTMSAPGVAAGYRALYSPNNENNPYKTYGKERAIRVNILSIVLLGDASGRAPTGATVRFQRSVYDKTSGSSLPLDNKIATLAFAYKPNLQMDERYRIANPLGFQVSDYRVSTDYASTPPDTIEAATASPHPNGAGASGPPAATGQPADENPLGLDVATPLAGVGQAPAGPGVGARPAQHGRVPGAGQP